MLIYTIIANWINDNYDITFIDGTYTVNKAIYVPGGTAQQSTVQNPIVTAEGVEGDDLSLWTLSDGWVWVDSTAIPENDGIYWAELDVSHLVDNYDFTGIAEYNPVTKVIRRGIQISVSEPPPPLDWTLLLGIGGVVVGLLLVLLLLLVIFKSKEKKEENSSRV